MIEFFQIDGLGKASFENVEIGDQFACIFYTQYERVVSKALDLKVIRSGERDVICKRISGDDFELKFSRKGFNAYCYPIGHEKVIKARESIRLANRIFKCRGIMDANRKYDAELMDAIEAFGLRIRGGGMRIYSIRQRYGLTWRGKYPPVAWRVIVDALLLVALMFSSYALVEYVTKNAALSDRAVVAERQQVKAEIALAHCLNGKSLNAGNEGWIICEKAYWAKL